MICHYLCQKNTIFVVAKTRLGHFIAIFVHFMVQNPFSSSFLAKIYILTLLPTNTNVLSFLPPFYQGHQTNLSLTLSVPRGILLGGKNTGVPMSCETKWYFVENENEKLLLPTSDPSQKARISRRQHYRALRESIELQAKKMRSDPEKKFRESGEVSPCLWLVELEVGEYKVGNF